MKKILSLLLFFMILYASSEAQKKKTYLYLEVNKNLPVSIKLNDKPIKNERRGYIIINNLNTGSINVLSFDFANPDFQNHEFHIDNLDEKSMGLKLARVADNRFVLQDVVSNRIIYDQRTGNATAVALVEEAADDAVPTQQETPKKVKTNTVDSPKKTETKKATLKKENVATKEKKEKTVVVPKPIPKKKEAVKVAAVSNSTPSRTYAMYKNRRPASENIATKRNKNYRKARREARREARNLAKAQAAAAERAANSQQATEKTRAQNVEADVRETKEVVLKKKSAKRTNAMGIEEKIINAEPVGKAANTTTNAETNSPANLCANTVRAEKVADWSARLHKKFDDEARENYIEKKLGSKCISAQNMGVLLGNMETQIGRYKLIRTLYPQMEDPANLDKFYKFFTSASYINKLKDLARGIEN